MTARSVLADTLNRVLGLDLADFTGARVFLRSPEGDALLEAWLSAHRNDEIPENIPLAEQAGAIPGASVPVITCLGPDIRVTDTNRVTGRHHPGAPTSTDTAYRK